MIFRILLISLISLLPLLGYGATYTTISDGPWNDSNTWSGGSIPSFTMWSTSTINIDHNVTHSGNLSLDGNTTINISSTGSIDATGSFSMNNFLVLNVDGSITSGGQFYLNGPTFTGNPTLDVGTNLVINNGEFIPATIQATIAGDFSIVYKDVDIGTGTIAVGNNFSVTGGNQVEIDADMTVGNDFSVTNGPASVFNGTVQITNDLIKGGGSSLSFYEDVTVLGTTDVSNGSNASKEFYIGPDSYFSTPNYTSNGGFKAWIDGVMDVSSGTISITGGGLIEGTGVVGWDTFITSAGRMMCSDGTNYDGEAGNHPYPPANPLNLGTCAGDVLPVEFLSIKGSEIDNYILIEWETATEKNNKVFEIQRTTDGSAFKTIGTIEGAGNSSSILKYQFKDFDLSEKSAYYRIRQIDYEGGFSFSDVIYVEKELGRVKVYPNQIAGSGTIIIEGRPGVIKGYKIVSSTGTVFKEGAADGSSGKTEVAIDSNLKKGMYFLHINTSEGFVTERLFIQ